MLAVNSATYTIENATDQSKIIALVIIAVVTGACVVVFLVRKHK